MLRRPDLPPPAPATDPTLAGEPPCVLHDRALRRRGLTILATTALAIGALAAALLPLDAAAAMFKCRAPGGGVEYSDKPCNGDPKAKPFVPKPLNTVSSESLTGRKAEPPPEKDVRPEWLRPLNPIEDCRKKGGEFDKEFRACKMPLQDVK